MVRLWMLVLFLLIAPADAQTFHYYTDPPGARVTLVGTPDRILGVSNEALPVPTSGNLVHLRFELDGYKPEDVTVPRSSLGGMRPPLPLHRKMSWTPVVVSVLGMLVGTGLLLKRFWGKRVAQVQRPPERSGTRVGPYLLIEMLGRGGAGEVFRAMRQDGQAPQGEVALKLVRPERREREEAARRLARETVLLKRLAHPAIVHFLDSGKDDETLYLVEELLEGGDLATRIPPQGMPVPDFLAAFRPVVDAVAFAHEQGVLHRDLKPANVLLTSQGDVRVTDFGLARADESTVMTTNHCMGTPVYMAPELFSGQRATPLTDQYALGVMAYQMLCGEPPFQGDSVMELVAQHLKPPKRIERPLPRELHGIVERMLAAEPEARFPTLREVASALQQLEG